MSFRKYLIWISAEFSAVLMKNVYTFPQPVQANDRIKSYWAPYHFMLYTLWSWKSIVKRPNNHKSFDFYQMLIIHFVRTSEDKFSTCYMTKIPITLTVCGGSVLVLAEQWTALNRQCSLVTRLAWIILHHHIHCTFS